ncbi:dihydrolipoyl dehydrogenase [Mucisphaera calidilacus]|uniref:Dihydrolipoyl dehydrogenase n=1 Tax=Mucisphaera calidilacus TaxID=2527982 RepID=A0A518BTH8_9BACT|nr:dihydrolipoyl dehydrogenase [Mucisphaera calidilacus]QDU70274.1 Dihydrolipoyl dehydrogenase [Mucisphaera calidilacus]
MANKKHDLLIIGAGPGGYVAAIRAAQLGLDVACVDENDALGGTCLRIGCIPSKALLESSEHYEVATKHLKQHGIKTTGVELDLPTMLKRKDKVVTNLTKGIAALFKKNKITRYHGRGSFAEDRSVKITGGKDDGTTVNATSVIIATGSVPVSLPGVDLEHPRIDTSTEALEYDAVPEKLAVIGAGAIGLELGSVWRRLGADVTVIEFLDYIMPGADREIADEAQKIFKKQGINFILGARVTGATGKPHNVTLEIEDHDPMTFDRVLVAVGRKPNTDGLGLEHVGVTMDDRGRIKTDSHFETSADHIFAIGDAVAGPMLAHKAEEEAVACVEHIVNGASHIDYAAIPSIVYTEPEIASVGKTEQQLQDANIDYRKGVFPYLGNGRAQAIAAGNGKVKVLADATTDRLLGVHIIGRSAGDLVAEAAVAIAMHASAEDLARSPHAHPTLAETIKEAALAAADRAIHV